MAKTIVHHHQPGREPKPFVLIKDNKDGTADFGLEDGTVIVSRCPVGKQADPHRSYCTIGDKPAAKSKTELKKAAAELRAKANEARKAADAASAAAEAGKDAEDAEALVAAALEAEQAAQDADKAADEAEAAAK